MSGPSRSRASSAPSWIATARVLARLAWARTMSPGVIAAVLMVLSLPVVLALGMGGGMAMEDATQFLLQRYGALVSGFATPVLALLLGTSAFTAESEDGTVLYLVTTTTPRWWIVASRMLFAAILTALLSSLTVVATGVIVLGAADSGGVVPAFAAGVSVGAAVYAALFTLLSLWTRRALMMGLLYVIVWEGVLSSTFQALRYLSVRQWIVTVAASLTDTTASSDGGVPLSFVLPAALFVLVASVIAGARLLDRPRIARTGA
ncbi:MAG TPA: hypothetical protein VGE27_08195 [Gemmatimonas sp.]|uniref:hypothetical protein n=1 Tax=Gemmatimonas sp. TaxID=1962908 RepID=UPI002EDBA5FE